MLRHTWGRVLSSGSQSDSKCQSCCCRVRSAARDFLRVHTFAAWFSPSLVKPVASAADQTVVRNLNWRPADGSSALQRETKGTFQNSVCGLSLNGVRHSRPRASWTRECARRRRTERYLAHVGHRWKSGLPFYRWWIVGTPHTSRTRQTWTEERRVKSNGPGLPEAWRPNQRKKPLIGNSSEEGVRLKLSEPPRGWKTCRLALGKLWKQYIANVFYS